MSMIQRVEKLPDVHVHNPAATDLHEVLPQDLQRLMRRPSRPEAIRTVQKVLLVDRLQRHDDRPLKDLILQSRDAQRTSLVARPFRNTHPTYRRRPVRAGLGTFEERLKIVKQTQA